MLSTNRKFAISRLDSGGLIPNYYCTSNCRHCLYACSPSWEKKYIDSETTEKNILRIKRLGCQSIHIGGGEPFLNLDGLKMVIETAHSLGVQIEYVETNSSWYRGRDSTCQILSSLKKRGLSMLLISMSPFHNEHIPFYKVKGVVEACHAVGMKVFPWISEFFSEITPLGDKTTHGLSEYENKYGTDYLKRLPSRYWIHFGGRALKTFADVLGTRPYDEILSVSKTGCRELLDVSHFHLDLFDNYIPGLCSGLAIHRDDLGDPLAPENYSVLHTLFDSGVTGLCELVSNKYDFKPSGRYMSKCHFCLDIRRYLVLDRGLASRDLQPKGFYENI
jgi:hypothetical protein